MKIATMLVLGSLAIASTARADQPGPDWMPMEQVKAKVLQSGYTQVTKIEAAGKAKASRTDKRWNSMPTPKLAL
jgi:hypothetical protein